MRYEKAGGVAALHLSVMRRPLPPPPLDFGCGPRRRPFLFDFGRRAILASYISDRCQAYTASLCVVLTDSHPCFPSRSSANVGTPHLLASCGSASPRPAFVLGFLSFRPPPRRFRARRRVFVLVRVVVRIGLRLVCLFWVLLFPFLSLCVGGLVGFSARAALWPGASFLALGPCVSQGEHGQINFVNTPTAGARLD